MVYISCVAAMALEEEGEEGQGQGQGHTYEEWGADPLALLTSLFVPLLILSLVSRWWRRGRSARLASDGELGPEPQLLAPLALGHRRLHRSLDGGKVYAAGDEVLDSKFMRRRGNNSWSLVAEGSRVQHLMESGKEVGSGDGLTSLFSSAHEAPRPNASVEPLTAEAAARASAEAALSDDSRLVLNALRGLQVFGAGQEELLLRLSAKVRAEAVGADEMLVEPTSPPKDLFVLSEGSISMYADISGKRRTFMRVQEKGAMLTSLLDLMAMTLSSLGGSEGMAAQVGIRADTACRVLKVPDARKLLASGVFEEEHVRAQLLRMMLVRSTRVSLMTTYRYLGLIHHLQCPLEPSGGDQRPVEGLDCLTLTDGALPPKDEERVKKAVAGALGIDTKLSQSLPPVRASGPSSNLSGEEIYSSSTRRRRPGQAGRCLYLVHLEAGSRVMEDTTDEPPSIYVVLSGSLTVEVTEERVGLLQDVADPSPSASLGPGSIVGHLALLSGSTSEWYRSRGSKPPMLTVRASRATWAVRISNTTHDHIMAEHQTIVAHAARDLLRRLPHVVRLNDYATSYLNLQAGDVLVKRGENCSSLYIVLHGRLRAVAPKNVLIPPRVTGWDDPVDATQALHEEVLTYGRGQFVGESEVISRGPHWATVVAARPSSLAKVPVSVLSHLSSAYPSVVSHLARHAADKKALHQREAGRRGGQPKEFLIVAASPRAVAAQKHFVQSMAASLEAVGRSTNVITVESVASQMGLTLGDGAGRGGWEGGPVAQALSLAFSGWLSAEVERFDVTLYQAEPAAENDSYGWGRLWNVLCSQQADVVLLVVDAADPPQLSRIERQLGINTTRLAAETVLILLHVDPPPAYRPKNTRDWFTNRSVLQHYHIRIRPGEINRSDFMRVARCLTGQGVGLVLGGGGARGMAHVGVLMALEEQQVPVDMVGGTSMGAFVGGLFAMKESLIQVLPPLHRFIQGMSSTWTQLRDLTFPFTSYFSGYTFNLVMTEVFDETHIEDTWLPFFCVTTNLSKSDMGVHQNGTMWRYVRASMSLVGFLPPMCEVDKARSDDDHDRVAYLVDGGYLNQLPVDVMKTMGASIVIACDVTGEWSFSGDNFGDSLSGMMAFLRTKLLPFAAASIPSMGDMSQQLAFISSVKQRNQITFEDRDLYIRPAVGSFTIMDFRKSMEIQRHGYEAAIGQLQTWKRAAIEDGWLLCKWPHDEYDDDGELNQHRSKSLSSL